VFVTTGSDNALKQWSLDNLDGTPRLVRSRTGHKQPPRRIRYRACDTTVADSASAHVHEILSAGADRQLRVFHAALERQNRELSQGDVAARAKRFRVSADALRLPPIVDFDMSDRRLNEWCNVVSAHAGLPMAYMWNWAKKKVGKHVLRLPAPAAQAQAQAQGRGRGSSSGSTPDAGHTQTVTAVCISACGNFAIIGGSLGTIAMFNMQSGLARGTVPKRVTGASTRSNRATVAPRSHSNRVSQPLAFRATRAPRLSLARSIARGIPSLAGVAGVGTATVASAPCKDAHVGRVTGLAVDALNKVLVSAGVDGQLKLWSMDTRKELWSADVGVGIAQLVLHKDAGACCGCGCTASRAS